jgi:hypothetical protein
MAFSVETATVALSAQQPAEHPSEPSSQQSHLQFWQVQMPLSQQHPPSGQQLVQAQAFAAFGEIILPRFAPIANPIPTTHKSTSAAASFMFNFSSKDLRTVVCFEALAASCELDALFGNNLHRQVD